MLKVAGIIPDIHIPWHDKAALDCCLSVLVDLQIKLNRPLDQLNLLGDVADFAAFKSWDKLKAEMKIDGTKQGHAKYEIQELVKFLTNLRKLFPKTHIRFLEGNHEDRFHRYLLRGAPLVWEYINLQEILKLKDLEIEWVPFQRDEKPQYSYLLNTSCLLRHRPTNGGKHCAASTLSNAHKSVVFGDTHRRQSYCERTLDRVEIETISLGWLGDPSAPVFSYMDTDNWAHSFGVAYQFSEDVEDYIIDVVKIKNSRAIYNATVYQGT